MRTNCPDCEGRLEPVMIIDATDRGMGGGVGHVELSYAPSNSVASSITQTITSAGQVKAMMCVECGRILLYGTGTVGGLRRE
ncbi:MAG: hypothetical protein KDB14_16545 [Planctomycetales bacterium]|nr:hypothetical protein [Planctomycetales bacterium]